MFIFERERQSMSGGGAERETHTESEAGSRLWAVSMEPDMGLEIMNCEVMTWAEVRQSTDWATHVPLNQLYFLDSLILSVGSSWQPDFYPWRAY